MEKAKLYVDMDGTIAKFHHVDTLEVLYEKGYFLNLEPIEKVLKAVKSIIRKDEIDVAILSAVLNSDYALDEKHLWLDKNLPEVQERIFMPCGEDKREYVNNLSEHSFLLDDYTSNLQQWCDEKNGQAHGTGIKLLNGINHSKKTWKGEIVDAESETLAEDIINVIEGKIKNIEIESLAQKINDYIYDYDTYGYWDQIGSSIEDKENYKMSMIDDIKRGNVTSYIDQLMETIIYDEDIKDEEREMLQGFVKKLESLKENVIVQEKTK